MATRQETADYILDVIARAGEVSARKMFGEYGVYLDGKFLAQICDDTFFIKPTKDGLAFAGDIEMGEPYPGARPAILISSEKLEDEADWVCKLLRITWEALPLPKPKKAKEKKT